VRTLADDLGRWCGGGAHLRGLRRVSVGGFSASESAPPDTVQLLTLREAVRDYPTVAVTPEVASQVANGRVLPAFEGAGPWAVLDANGELLAMYETAGDDRCKPAVVIARD
jgi:tRNA pseudouridine55 synthase